MDFLKEIIVEILGKEECSLTFNISEETLVKIAKETCCSALSSIKRLVEDTSLDDFQVVEQIVELFESIGSDSGGRHDY